MDDLYRAIADPTRRAILDELVERDGQTLFELWPFDHEARHRFISAGNLAAPGAFGVRQVGHREARGQVQVSLVQWQTTEGD